MRKESRLQYSTHRYTATSTTVTRYILYSTTHRLLYYTVKFSVVQFSVVLYVCTALWASRSKPKTRETASCSTESSSTTPLFPPQTSTLALIFPPVGHLSMYQDSFPTPSNTFARMTYLRTISCCLHVKILTFAHFKLQEPLVTKSWGDNMIRHGDRCTTQLTVSTGSEGWRGRRSRFGKKPVSLNSIAPD